jgi:hypothetical protein
MTYSDGSAGNKTFNVLPRITVKFGVLFVITEISGSYRLELHSVQITIACFITLTTHDLNHDPCEV